MLIYEQCKECPVCIAKREELLQECDSVYDAIYEHQQFLISCTQTCARRGLSEQSKNVDRI